MSVVLPNVVQAIARRAARQLRGVGICGPQGSGKSTLARALAADLNAKFGLRAAILSLDDLYLGTTARRDLAARVHPLFATRGVPGTHDVSRGIAVLDALKSGGAAMLPRFDKARDEPGDDEAAGPVDVVLFEGWCVGVPPQADAALAAPVNRLEAAEDADGVWRRHVNAALAGEYQTLFARIDMLVLLRPPSFDCVLGWRRQQEAELRAACGGGMRDAEVARFVLHFERLTRHLLAVMPARADCVIDMDAARQLRIASSAE